jgi:hypothetical protein
MGFLFGLYLIDWDQSLSIEGFTIDSNAAFMFCLFAQLFRNDVNWYVLISDLDVVDTYSGTAARSCGWYPHCKPSHLPQRTLVKQHKNIPSKLKSTSTPTNQLPVEVKLNSEAA